MYLHQVPAVTAQNCPLFCRQVCCTEQNTIGHDGSCAAITQTVLALISCGGRAVRYGASPEELGKNHLRISHPSILVHVKRLRTHPLQGSCKAGLEMLL